MLGEDFPLESSGAVSGRERETVGVHAVPSGPDRGCIIHQEDSSVSLLS